MPTNSCIKQVLGTDWLLTYPRNLPNPCFIQFFYLLPVAALPLSLKSSSPDTSCIQHSCSWVAGERRAELKWSTQQRHLAGSWGWGSRAAGTPQHKLHCSSDWGSLLSKVTHETHQPDNRIHHPEPKQDRRRFTYTPKLLQMHWQGSKMHENVWG